MKSHVKWAFTRCLFFSVSFVWAAFVAQADQFDILNSKFSGTTQALHGATSGAGSYVAVGDNGTILYSTDTITWVPQISGTTNRLNGVKYGTNGFVAVGASSPGGFGAIWRSSDGIHWVQQTSLVTNELFAICYASGRYVAVGSQGIILTSTNAINWKSINTGAPYNLNGIDGGPFLGSSSGQLFVAVGESGTIMSSPDGLAWTVRFSGTFSRLTAVSVSYGAYNPSGWINSIIAAVGNSGTIVTSTDSSTWTVQNSGTSNDLYGVANDGGGRFGAVGSGGVFFTTADGLSWISEPSVTATNLNGLIYANGNFLALGDSGVVQAGIAWLPRNPGTTQSLFSASYGNNTYVVDANNSILSSTNGIDWHPGYSDQTTSIYGITFGSNLFVAFGVAGQAGKILTSTNGFNWTSQNLGATNVPYSMAYGNGAFLAIGANGIVYRSIDGLSWSGSFPKLPFTYYNQFSAITVAFGSNLFIASCPDLNMSATSSDGSTWTNGSGTSFYSLAFGNGSFVAVYGGDISSSTDGFAWTTKWDAHHINNAVTFGNQGFVDPGYQGYGTNNSISTSSDGITWVTRAMASTYFVAELRAVTFGNGSYLIVGDAGTILQSTPINAQATPLIGGAWSNGLFNLSAIAQPGYSYRVQVSTNLSNWSDLQTFISTQTVTTFADTAVTNSGSRFYRIKTP